MTDRARPSLRRYLTAAPAGSQVVAYLTIGDPSDRFAEVADELLAAGALTLELGLPHPKPLEGPTLLASHQRALASGVNSARAVELLRCVSARRPSIPLAVVAQADALADNTDGDGLLDLLAGAGVAAVLPVGASLWQLPALSARIEARGLETVIACPVAASRKFRDIAMRYCSGALYVPRAKMTGNTAEARDAGEFCAGVAAETDLPMIVGVGVETARDVAQICATAAKAAAVGSALVAHINRGGSAGEFIRGLLGR
jgi:tryptophan synthase alpha chain